MDCAINVGIGQKQTEAVGDLIREIINSPCGGQVKIAALEAMSKTLSVNNATISGATVYGSQDTHHHYHGPEEIDGEFLEKDEEGEA